MHIKQVFELKALHADRSTYTTGFPNLVRNRMPIDRLIIKESDYIPRFLPIIRSLDGLLALFRMTFKLVTKIYTSPTKKNINVGIRKIHKA